MIPFCGALDKLFFSVASVSLVKWQEYAYLWFFYEALKTVIMFEDPQWRKVEDPVILYLMASEFI